MPFDNKRPCYLIRLRGATPAIDEHVVICRLAIRHIERFSPRVVLNPCFLRQCHSKRPLAKAILNMSTRTLTLIARRAEQLQIGILMQSTLSKRHDMVKLMLATCSK